jgi:hypothetical protein
MDGQEFLDQLSSAGPKGFESEFSRTAVRLGLGKALASEELDLLLKAAFLATLCHIAFNGLGGCANIIRPDREAHRSNLEHKFLQARDAFYATPGWQALPDYQSGPIERIFLSAFVTDENLAW